MSQPIVLKNSENIPFKIASLMNWTPAYQEWMKKKIFISRCPRCNKIFAWKRERKYCSKECQYNQVQDLIGEE